MADLTNACKARYFHGNTSWSESLMYLSLRQVWTDIPSLILTTKSWFTSNFMSTYLNRWTCVKCIIDEATRLNAFSYVIMILSYEVTLWILGKRVNWNWEERTIVTDWQNMNLDGWMLFHCFHGVFHLDRPTSPAPPGLLVALSMYCSQLSLLD